MANREHLKILEQGIDIWNEWRKKNDDVIPDLSQSDLSKANLSRANLNQATLSEADLFRVNLSRASLIGANLRRANLDEGNLKGANLSEANLKGAKLIGAELTEANLSRAYLRKANLSEAYLNKAHLNQAHLEEAYLFRANLFKANLIGANLSGSDLIGSFLYEANLKGANLTTIQALKTNFERAILTATCIQDWNINQYTNLNNVKCGYIFFKATENYKEGKYIFEKRCPHEEDTYFEPGDFEQLVRKPQKTIDLFSRNSIDGKKFSIYYAQLNLEKGKIQKLEEEYEIQLLLKDEKINFLNKKIHQQEKFYSEQIKDLLSLPIELTKEITKLTGVITKMAENNNSSYDLRGSKFGGGFAVRDQTGGTLYDYSTNSEAKQNLAEAAQEIQQLLKHLEQSNPTETTVNQMAFATQAIEVIKNRPTLKQRVIGVLKSAGTEAFKEAINHPVANILVAGFQGWIEP
ncbi:MAG: pentapeptide repeat-containing protein [Trichodesmium sp. St18_bin1]|jgi:uncharacterized protein YjbI with pentapeptide repeats|nr:pentapeptide repeat-containing protein [Trichodesmium sp. St18_bin1]